MNENIHCKWIFSFRKCYKWMFTSENVLEENLPMATIIEQSELVSRALFFLSEKCAENPDGDLAAMLPDEAGMRFNLGPRDAACLERLFRKEVVERKNGPKNKKFEDCLICCGFRLFPRRCLYWQVPLWFETSAFRPEHQAIPRNPAISAGYQTLAQDAKPRRALLPIWLAGRRLVAAKYFSMSRFLRIALFRDISASPRKHPKTLTEIRMEGKEKSAGSAQA